MYHHLFLRIRIKIATECRVVCSLENLPYPRQTSHSHARRPSFEVQMLSKATYVPQISMYVSPQVYWNYKTRIHAGIQEECENPEINVKIQKSFLANFEGVGG